MFPTIRRLEDVLPAIEGRPEFVVGKRDGYQFVDYNYADKDTFDCPIRRECRGIKFDLDGNLIARPFHKFFNLHERPDEVPDLSGDDHVVMEKLDGSMVHAVWIEEHGLTFMTRAGISQQAVMAWEAAERIHYGESLFRFCRASVSAGYTPVFEYTSPNNQIVVRYSDEDLTLLAIRDNETGEYIQRIEEIGLEWGIPTVRTFGQSARDLDAFVAHTRALTDTEGYVIRCGQWLGKMKADAYVASHRARSGLLWEKDVLRLVLENKVDDVVGLLPKEEAERLQAWSEGLNSQIRIDANFAVRAVERAKELSENRAGFAQAMRDAALQQPMTSWCFSIYDGRDPVEVIRQHGLKQCSSGAKAREFLEFLGVEPWTATPCDLEG